ncbi:MAG TPA: nuclease-related domain-containing protein [Acidimicrobiales bacterium]|nr:nuclease-related domain-containing protein [Acidimicrobiales bacterium]
MSADDRRSSADELAEKFEERAKRTRAAAATERATATHLDDALTPFGFYCLHDCRWPGSRRANIDHVVIGRTGIWVVDDKRMTNRLSVSAKGELWSGRHPMRKELEKAVAQRDAVAGALGSTTAAVILSIHEGLLPAPAFRIGAVHVAKALHATSQLIRDGGSVLDDAEVGHLAERAMAVLQPRETSRPTMRPPEPIGRATLIERPSPVPDRVPWIRVPSAPPDFSRLPPAPSDVVPAAKKRARPPKRRRQRSSRLRSVAFGLLVAWLAIGFGAEAARWIGNVLNERVMASVDAASNDEPTSKPVSQPTLRHVCDAPGSGWTLIVAWSGSVSSATWSSTPEGPWEPLASSGPHEGRRGYLLPAQVSLIRLTHTAADGSPVDAMLMERAPNQSC